MTTSQCEVMHNSAKFASSSEAKALCAVTASQCESKSCYTVSFASNSEAQAQCAMSASPCEAESDSEAILASPPTKQKALKAKSKVS